MSFSRVAPVVFQPFYRCFDWSRHLWPMAQTAADVPGARGGELNQNLQGFNVASLEESL
jgi:hypothetical protein